jgi:hypothetical protein
MSAGAISVGAAVGASVAVGTTTGSTVTGAWVGVGVAFGVQAPSNITRLTAIKKKLLSSFFIFILSLV